MNTSTAVNEVLKIMFVLNDSQEMSCGLYLMFKQREYEIDEDNVFR